MAPQRERSASASAAERIGWKEGMLRRSTCGPFIGSTLKAARSASMTNRSTISASSQRGARHGIGILAELSEPPIEGVEPSAPCVEGFRRLVLEAVVESAVADRGGEGRVMLERLVPEVVGELVERGGFGGGGHPAIVPMRRVARRPFGA